MRATLISLSVALVAALSLTAPAAAGPDDPSQFDGTPYTGQKALYDFNHPQPEDGLRALGYIRNHLRAIEEFGEPEKSHIVAVAHGEELHAFSRHNRLKYPDAYERLKVLADQGVTFYICRNAAKGRGYEPEDFYDIFTVIPAAVIEITKWQNKGYSYMYPDLHEGTHRDDLSD